MRNRGFQILLDVIIPVLFALGMIMLAIAGAYLTMFWMGLL